MTTALLVDAKTGSPLAPRQMHVGTSDAVYSTSKNPPAVDAHHLEQLAPTMEEVEGWDLPRRVVPIIDREGDSLGHFRQWAPQGHLFLVRGNDRRVSWEGESWLISEIVEYFDQAEEFEDMREVSFQGVVARQEVAETTIVLDRPHKTLIDGKQRVITSEPLEIRLIATRIVDSKGYILAEWILLTNVAKQEADASEIALWYYRRWRIERFFKLLKSHGLQMEYWQQESGEAIARRLLVAAMACVVVWDLQRQEAPSGRNQTVVGAIEWQPHETRRALHGSRPTRRVLRYALDTRFA